MSRNILLAPHNDDEVLFASYICLKHHPLVIVVLRSYLEELWPGGPTWQQRETETQHATRVLGCQYQQLTWPDSNPPWDEIRQHLSTLEPPNMVWAPLPEPDGHPHHNAIGEIAQTLFPRVSYYSTYTRNNGNAIKTTTGQRIEPKPEWQATKRVAMRYYQTQAQHPNTHLPFDTWPTDEYITTNGTHMAKPGPKPGSQSARRTGAQGGRSRPSLKDGPNKQGARHSVPKGKPNKGR